MFKEIIGADIDMRIYLNVYGYIDRWTDRLSRIGQMDEYKFYVLMPSSELFF